ncbi:Aspartate aminotransferase, partial [Globisporangium splendens]
MEVAQKQRDVCAFQAFLQQHRYAPQGRLARAGMLQDADLDALLRGNLVPVWRWVSQNVKTPGDMELIRRNVEVAKHHIESRKQERDDANKRRAALESRRQYLSESIARAKVHEKQLLQALRAMEREDEAMVVAAVDAKQRSVLKLGHNHQNGQILATLAEHVSQLNEKATVDDVARRRLQTAASGDNLVNPIEMLLAEYLRMLKAGKTADEVDFGDSDIKHLREFGGNALTEWIIASAKNADSLATQTQEEAEYAAHVEEHTISSHDTLTQVQDLLRRNQQEHIKKFLETQRMYAKVRQLKEAIHELKKSSRYDLWNEISPASAQEGNGCALSLADPGEDKLTTNAAARTVDLEIECNAQQASLNAAKQTYESMTQQIEASKQQKLDLDEKLELMRTFDARQQEMIDHIDTIYRQNHTAMLSIAQKQEQLQRFVHDKLHPGYIRQSEAALEKWWRLVLEEVRRFSSVQLARVDTTVKSVAMTLSDAHGTTTRHVNLAVPYPDFYINQIQQESRDSSSKQQHGFGKVFQALKIPEYGSWSKVLSRLLSNWEDNAAETLHARLEKLEQYLHEDQTQHDSGRVDELLADIKSTVESLQSSALPQLEDIMMTNDATRNEVLPRLHSSIENWFLQSGWSVHLDARDTPGNPLE